MSWQPPCLHDTVRATTQARWARASPRRPAQLYTSRKQRQGKPPSTSTSISTSPSSRKQQTTPPDATALAARRSLAAHARPCKGEVRTRHGNCRCRGTVCGAATAVPCVCCVDSNRVERDSGARKTAHRMKPQCADSLLLRCLQSLYVLRHCPRAS